MKKILKKIGIFILILTMACAAVFSLAGCFSDGPNETGGSDMLEEANRYIEENAAKTDSTYRGEYHFTPQIGWINDPNGFTYYKGEYHIFYQYNPYGSTNAGAMYWGHATSKDLVRWTHKPVALAPDQNYDADGCWSGSAIVVGERLYLFYTGHYDRGGVRVQTQNVAYSDDGVHFTKYENNPVVGPDQLPEGTSAADFRDPYVWEQSGKYYMLVGTMETGAAKVQLYESDNLFDWQYKNDFLRSTHAGYCWECPNYIDFGETELFAFSGVDFPASGYAFQNYNSAVYALGEADFASGTMKISEFRELDVGLDFYAEQIIRCGEDTVMTAWMNMWGRSYVTSQLGHGWSGSLILPRTLAVKNGKLLQRPVAAISEYYENKVCVEDTLSGTKEYEGVNGTVARIKLTADMSSSKSFTVSVFCGEGVRTDISYNKEEGIVTFDRSESGITISSDPREASRAKSRCAAYAPEGDVLEMEIFLDKSSVEVFFGAGELTMTSLSYNPVDAGGIIFSSDGETLLRIEKQDIKI